MKTARRSASINLRTSFASDGGKWDAGVIPTDELCRAGGDVQGILEYGVML